MCTQRQVEGTYAKDELNGRGSGGQSLQCPGQGKQDTHAAHGRQQREHDGGVAYWHTLSGSAGMLATLALVKFQGTYT